MDVCDGGRDTHEWVAYGNAVGCPVCEVREEMEEMATSLNEEIAERVSEIDDLQSQLQDAEEKLSKYEHMDDAIKKMVEERL